MELDFRASPKRKRSAPAVRAGMGAGRVDRVVVARSRKAGRRRLQQVSQVVDRASGRLVVGVLNRVRFDGSLRSYEYDSGYPSDDARAAAGKDSS